MTAMSVSVPAIELPSSRGEWCRWAEAQIEALEFGEESELLRVLAGRARGDGSAEIGMELLMRKLKKSRATVLRHLKALRDRGLVRTERRGRGRVSLHRLVAEPVECQLSLFDDVGRGLAAAPAEPVRVSAAASPPPPATDTGRPIPAPAAEDPAAPSWGLTSAAMGSHQCDPAVEGQQQHTEEGGARERSQTDRGLSPSLAPVLEVLNDAPGLFVVDAAVNAALLAFPHADHLQAAHRVASWAHEGGLNAGAANRLLWRALERQAAAGPRAERCDDGRRRRRAPETSEARVPGRGPEAVAALREMRLAMAAARGEVQS